MTHARTDILHAILKTAPDAIIRIDSSGMIVDFLGCAEAMFGFRSDEVVGHPVALLMPENVGQEHDGFISTFIETGKSKLPNFARQLQAVHKEGHIFPVEIALSEMMVGGDRSFVGIVRNIKNRLEVETELADLRERLLLSSTSNALGESASVMAHELNQPLTAIANYSDALEIKLSRMEGDEAKQLRALAQKAGDQARLSGEIVKRMRRLLVKREFDPESGDFHEAVRQSVESVSKGISTHNVELFVKRSGDRIDIRFDRIQLHQVVAHLMSNALSAVKDSKVKQIIVETVIEGGIACVSVTDTGKGVPDERKKEIFELFVGEGKSGLGLGLAVAKRIADVHSGSIDVGDAEEAGAIFTFSFPIDSSPG